MGWTSQVEVTADANGRAFASYSFAEPGTYRVNAASGVSTNDEIPVTGTAADVGSNGGGAEARDIEDAPLKL
ncbi:MAG: hypothetical protein ACXVIF_01925 [Halobacteriota archaeon]